jgi:hypothetical protein
MWNVMAWHCIFTRSNGEGLKKCCISNAVDGTYDDTWWNDFEEDVNVRVSVRKM